MGVKVYYWKHTTQNWGHISMSLSDGTHISWWPNRPINEHKKIPGRTGLAIAAIFEWVDIIPDMTLDKDMEYEGSKPTEIIEFPAASLDESKIKLWWSKFKTKNKYNGLRLNCSTVVWYGLKAGGALKYVKDPNHWWWDPISVLEVAKGIKRGVAEKHVISVSVPNAPPEFERLREKAAGAIYDEL